MMNFNKLGKTKCKYCGCDDLHACKGGCFWIDKKSTICSTCAVNKKVSFAHYLNESKAIITEAFYSWMEGAAVTVKTENGVIYSVTLEDFMDMFTEVQS